jgi:hypothetical protein
MAELVISLLQRGVADILHSPLTQAEKEYCAAPLPPPMVLGNYQALSSKCFVGDMFRCGVVGLFGYPHNRVHGSWLKEIAHRTSGIRFLRFVATLWA